MIELTRGGPVARLRLNRPAARNALAVRDWEGLADTVREIGDARVLVVSGAEGAFSAGADLAEFETFRGDPVACTGFRTAMRNGLDAVAALPIATVAWIDGPCFGAGVALAMACDIRIASSKACFAITPAKMGIGYPQEDVARLVRLVGPGWAARLLLTGDAIDAATALRIGLVEEVVEPDGFEAVLTALAAAAPESIAMLKRGILLAEAGALHDDEQDRRFDALLGSDAFAERLSRRRTGRGLPLARP
jgi:enoyl-CoA hydratase